MRRYHRIRTLDLDGPPDPLRRPTRREDRDFERRLWITGIVVLASLLGMWVCGYLGGAA
jgi:hypothetical protein